MALVALVASAAFATAAMAATELGEITIEGSRMVKEVTKSATTPGKPAIQEAKLTMGVSYSDLDLSLVKDGQELQRRVDAAAKTLCGELDKFFSPSDQNCVMEMAKQTQPKVSAAIKAASDARFAKAKADEAKAPKK
jgi:UrcA family protein